MKAAVALKSKCCFCSDGGEGSITAGRWQSYYSLLPQSIKYSVKLPADSLGAELGPRLQTTQMLTVYYKENKQKKKPSTWVTANPYTLGTTIYIYTINSILNNPYKTILVPTKHEGFQKLVLCWTGHLGSDIIVFCKRCLLYCALNHGEGSSLQQIVSGEISRAYLLYEFGWYTCWFTKRWKNATKILHG